MKKYEDFQEILVLIEFLKEKCWSIEINVENDSVIMGRLADYGYGSFFSKNKILISWTSEAVNSVRDGII
jgi:hypothetical protein